jgi:uncharacterized protein
MDTRTILIAGGTGMLGKLLQESLKNLGYSVRVLTRNRELADGVTCFHWNPAKQFCDPAALVGVQVVINLSGAGIADKRWTAERKKELIESRVQPAHTLCKAIAEYNLDVHYISASGINCVSTDKEDQWLDEEAAYGSDFLSQIVQQWEETVKNCPAFSKVTIMRISTVLSRHGGALAKMETPFRWYVGSPLGSGKQWMSWIHERDLVNAFVHVVQHEVLGVFNLTGEPVSNKEFSVELGRALKKPILPFGVPVPVLRILLGEMSSILLNGSRCSGKRLEATGFHYDFPKVRGALVDLYTQN